jgi:hypothetical protein
MFFGFDGFADSSSGILRGLQPIGYDFACVEDFKESLGADFGWTDA